MNPIKSKNYIKKNLTKKTAEPASFKNTKLTLTSSEVIENIKSWKKAKVQLSKSKVSSLFTFRTQAWKMSRKEAAILNEIKSNEEQDTKKPDEPEQATKQEDKPEQATKQEEEQTTKQPDKPEQEEPATEPEPEQEEEQTTKQPDKPEQEEPATEPEPEQEEEQEEEQTTKQPDKPEHEEEQATKQEKQDLKQAAQAKQEHKIQNFINEWGELSGNKITFTAKINTFNQYEIIHKPSGIIIPGVNYETVKLSLVNLNSINEKWENNTKQPKSEFGIACANAVMLASKIVNFTDSNDETPKSEKRKITRRKTKKRTITRREKMLGGKTSGEKTPSEAKKPDILKTEFHFLRSAVKYYVGKHLMKGVLKKDIESKVMKKFNRNLTSARGRIKAAMHQINNSKNGFFVVTTTNFDGNVFYKVGKKD